METYCAIDVAGSILRTEDNLMDDRGVVSGDSGIGAALQGDVGRAETIDCQCLKP